MFTKPIYKKYGSIITGLALGFLLVSTAFGKEHMRKGESNMINEENKSINNQ